jgi:hypothetical protein
MTESRFRPVARIFQNRRPLVLGSCRSGENCSTTAIAAAVGDENSRPPHGAVRMRNVIVRGSKVPSTRLRLYTLKTSISPSDLPSSVAVGLIAASALGVFAMRSSTSDWTRSATDDCDRLAAMASRSNVCWSTVMVGMRPPESGPTTHTLLKLLLMLKYLFDVPRGAPPVPTSGLPMWRHHRLRLMHLKFAGVQHHWRNRVGQELGHLPGRRSNTDRCAHSSPPRRTR